MNERVRLMENRLRRMARRMGWRWSNLGRGNGSSLASPPIKSCMLTQTMLSTERILI